MHFRRAQQQLLAAIAVLVMTFASLAPAWAAVINGTAGVAGWVELCSAEGTKRVAVDANGDPVSSETSKHQTSSGHCPFCHLQQTPATLPPAPAPVAVSDTHLDVYKRQRQHNALFNTATRAYNEANPNVYVAVSHDSVFDAKVLYRFNRQWSASLGVNNIGCLLYTSRCV